MNEMLNSGRAIPPGGVEDKLDLWSLRLACLNQILDPWVYIISRVTCCKSQRDSAKEPLRSASQARSISPTSTPSHIRRSTITSSSSPHAPSSPQWSRKQRSIVSRTLVAIRVLFKMRKPGKQYSVSHPAKDPEMTSVAPLRSSAPVLSLAESSVSSRCDVSTRMDDDGIC
ncbi:hypothetical protein ElyMa_000790600 [Elysia marginata]|uniref:G-protein coupled receptors family 1 profile domain-containing protein n=1 Tax=Elysia marginata TaxID=1093978 RepID=A0AAV4GTS7_9GAST|nr:hypothetical protein ElyMa_000790600 [Elysia marginata]